MGKHNPQTHLIPLLEVCIAQLANQIVSRFAKFWPMLRCKNCIMPSRAFFRQLSFGSKWTK